MLRHLRLEPKIKDLGEFEVRRLLPSAKQPMVGPWIFFDHFGPATFTPGQGVNVRPHPHINLATVTYLFEGEIHHRDSLGSDQFIQPGDINLMVAGRGITHSERERPELHSQGHRQHGLQLWLALPTTDEECEPAFHHYAAADLPVVECEGAQIRIMMGQAFGASSPVKTFAKTLYLEVNLLAGASFVLPTVEQAAIYLIEGALVIDGQSLEQYQMLVLKGDKPMAEIPVHAEQSARFAVIGGEPLGKRYIEWNFVSSRLERIEQAKADWQAGRFPTVPEDSEEFIPLPED